MLSSKVSSVLFVLVTVLALETLAPVIALAKISVASSSKTSKGNRAPAAARLFGP